MSRFIVQDADTKEQFDLPPMKVPEDTKLDNISFFNANQISSQIQCQVLMSEGQEPESKGSQ